MWPGKTRNMLHSRGMGMHLTEILFSVLQKKKKRRERDSVRRKWDKVAKMDVLKAKKERERKKDRKNNKQRSARVDDVRKTRK